MSATATFCATPPYHLRLSNGGVHAEYVHAEYVHAELWRYGLTAGWETREDAGVITEFLLTNSLARFPAVSLADLAISLIFGAGQVMVGGALAWRGMGQGRWRRAAPFAMALIGLWVVCSGVAELIVSGLQAAAQGWHTFAAQTVDAVRHTADAALFVTAVLLAVALGLYLVWWSAGGLGGRKRDVA